MQCNRPAATETVTKAEKAAVELTRRGERVVQSEEGAGRQEGRRAARWVSELSMRGGDASLLLDSSR